MCQIKKPPTSEAIRKKLEGGFTHNKYKKKPLMPLWRISRIHEGL